MIGLPDRARVQYHLSVNEALRRAYDRLQLQQRVRAMLATIEAILAGEITRAAALVQINELAAACQDAGRRFRGHADASVVFESLLSLDQYTEAGQPFVREVDLRAYRRWLLEGPTFIGTKDWVVGLHMSIDELAGLVGGEPVRSWNAGLGWFVELRFCAVASGRPFAAIGALEQSGGVGVHFRRDDIAHEALVDLFETLAIDDHDVVLHPDIDPTQLPQWALWREDDNGNRFEIERYRCYAKAVEQERIFTARGHRQSYWVDPV